MSRINPHLVLSLVLAAVCFPAASSAHAAERADQARADADAGLTALIDRRVDARLEAEGLTGEAFDRRVREAIIAFIKEQRAAARKRRQVSTDVPPVTAEDHVRGNPNAPVTIIEYADYECPYCRRYHRTLKELVRIDDDRVNWVYRHLPLPMHNPMARREALAAECAALQGGDSAFWRTTDLLFARTRSNGEGVPGGLEKLADEAGLDASELLACVEDERTAERVEDDMREAAELGIRGTPASFLVDNATGEVRALNGAQPLTELRQLIEQTLAGDDATQ